jgi:16S rRNA (guanine527-N7)-methyltransferase
LTSSGKFDFIKHLKHHVEKLEIGVSDESLENLKTYFDNLLEKKCQYNLVGKLNDKEIADKLFLDSLFGLKVISLSPGCSLLDVGTGAGFPGMVLKIARPEIHLSLLDASGKKSSSLKM